MLCKVTHCARHASVSDNHVPERFSLDHSAVPVGIVNETTEAVVWLPLTMDRGFVNRVQYQKVQHSVHIMIPRRAS